MRNEAMDPGQLPVMSCILKRLDKLCPAWWKESFTHGRFTLTEFVLNEDLLALIRQEDIAFI